MTRTMMLKKKRRKANKKRFFVISFVFILSYIFLTNTSLGVYENASLQVKNSINSTNFVKEKVKISEHHEKKSGLEIAQKIPESPGIETIVPTKTNVIPVAIGNGVTPAGEIPPSNRTVYLTFDDGPNMNSSSILTTLDQYNAKATFFMLDGNIRNFPDAVKQMVVSGHTVASHGVSHNKDIIYQSSQSVVGEMTQTRNTILEISGMDSTLIRTPYGSAPYMTDEYMKAVADSGLIIWDWNIDSKDWYYRDQRYVDAVISQIENKKDPSTPIVILLHEREETAAHLPTLLNYLTTNQYDLQALNSTISPIQF